MHITWRLPGAVVAVALLLDTQGMGIAAELTGSDVWQQWRGPNRNGQIQAAAWPESIGESNLKQRWKVELGPGYSGPIVTADRVFVTETKDKKLEVVRALDRSTGEQLWETSWEGAMSVPFFAKANGDWIRATPAFDGERLYVAGMRDVLVCLDGASGEILWQVDFVEETSAPLPAFGFASSPLVHGEHVYVQAGASFAKLDKLTGKIVWRTLTSEGGTYDSAFSSPVFAVIQGVPQFIVQMRDKLAGVAPEDGQVLWSQEIEAFRGMNILTPTVEGNTIFTSSYGGRSILLRVDRPDGQWQVEEVWQHKSQGYMSSPVVIAGHVYLHLRNQRVTCLELSTGKECWTTTPFGKYWSMVANGDKILALDEAGELLLVQANPDRFEVLDRRKFDANAWAHVGVAGNEVFIRHLKAITSLTWKN